MMREPVVYYMYSPSINMCTQIKFVLLVIFLTGIDWLFERILNYVRYNCLIHSFTTNIQINNTVWCNEGYMTKWSFSGSFHVPYYFSIWSVYLGWWDGFVIKSSSLKSNLNFLLPLSTMQLPIMMWPTEL